jgi:hypothetical protein
MTPAERIEKAFNDAHVARSKAYAPYDAFFRWPIRAHFFAVSPSRNLFPCGVEHGPASAVGLELAVAVPSHLSSKRPRQNKAGILKVVPATAR